MAVLIDTNILLALAFPRDVNHRRARDLMAKLTGAFGQYTVII